MGDCCSKDKDYSDTDQLGRARGQEFSDTANQEPEMIKTYGPVHSDAVVSLAAIQSGLCLSGSKDRSVALYDYHNHRLEEKWTGHEREVTKVCYGPNCEGHFSASRDKSVRMWRRGSPSPVQTFTGHDLVVTALHISNDSRLLCTGSRDNTVRLWDVEKGECLLENNIHRNLVTDVKFIPNSNNLVQTGEDKHIRIFETHNLLVTHTFPKKQYIQMCCDVSSDGNYCLTCSNGFGGNGCEATLYDLRSMKIVHEFKGHREAIESCIFLPFSGRNLIATASRDCSVRIWDRDTKECVTDTSLSGSGPLTSLICYDDSSLCVSSFHMGIYELKFSLANEALCPVARF
ncbi:WD repeat-containing protein 31-like isoform X2 [Ylistrum balloti]|uniref:WD repeat-containing protein 31-like isoform X2 n=1 Tax=Ylistrum balloti TaxID=509963 RepID=UPI002905A7F3|nr:WD repeat-containing protein 31-like isoform X2 [Ylistrum balloti]